MEQDVADSITILNKVDAGHEARIVALEKQIANLEAYSKSIEKLVSNVIAANLQFGMALNQAVLALNQMAK
jgi:flagellar biosynthesis/type III secretory pathway chaperone